MEFNSSKTVLAKGSGCCGTWIITLYFIFCVFTIVAKNNWIVRILDLIIWSFKLYTCIISILIVTVTIHMLSTAAKLIKECCLLFFCLFFFIILETDTNIFIFETHTLSYGLYVGYDIFRDSLVADRAGPIIYVTRCFDGTRIGAQCMAIATPLLRKWQHAIQRM